MPSRKPGHVPPPSEITPEAVWLSRREWIARAGLAAALACDPPILVADEPTAEVDRDTEAGLIAHFKARRAAGLSTLIATHSEALARRADRVVKLKDGRIENG